MIAFSGAPLDRADHVRSNPDALSGLMNFRARLLLLDGLDPVIENDSLVWGSLADADPDSELVFLGLNGDRGCFAAVPRDGSTAPPGPRLWQAVATLDPGDLATFGGAKALVDWHARHRFCARCGSATVLAKGGWQRTCSGAACGAEHFPRVDPVTIMLVEHQDDVLLGRQARFPPGNYSALAGFVEPGETIEEAVAREVLEESGITVNTVTYVASQPWPFPSSLMIGCHSIAENREITLDETELEDARWFTRDDVVDALEASDRRERGRVLGAPPPMAIAHHLLRWWVGKG